jgi:hypothetical protein
MKPDNDRTSLSRFKENPRDLWACGVPHMMHTLLMACHAENIPNCRTYPPPVQQLALECLRSHGAGGSYDFFTPPHKTRRHDFSLDPAVPFRGAPRASALPSRKVLWTPARSVQRTGPLHGMPFHNLIDCVSLNVGKLLLQSTGPLDHDVAHYGVGSQPEMEARIIR